MLQVMWDLLLVLDKYCIAVWVIFRWDGDIWLLLLEVAFYKRKEKKRLGELRIFPRIYLELRRFMEFYLGTEFSILLFTLLFFPNERLCDAHSLPLQFLC